MKNKMQSKEIFRMKNCISGLTFNNEIKFEITYNEMIKVNLIYVIVLNAINTSKSVGFTISIVLCNFQEGIIFFV